MNKATTSIDESIKTKIHTIRGLQVMLDSDLAELYGVETKQINKAVNRNREIFPINFKFQLTEDEYQNLRFQNGTSSGDDSLRSQFVTSSSSGSLMFQIGTLDDEDSLRSQIATLENGRGER